MRMIMMHVGCVLMIVFGGVVGVKVAVGANYGRVMAMGVMLVVVAVHVVVGKRVVTMRVAMLFGYVQDHAGYKEPRGGHNPSRDRTIAKRKSECSANKRRHRKDRACATSADIALRKQI